MRILGFFFNNVGMIFSLSCCASHIDTGCWGQKFFFSKPKTEKGNLKLKIVVCLLNDT